MQDGETHVVLLKPCGGGHEEIGRKAVHAAPMVRGNQHSISYSTLFPVSVMPYIVMMGTSPLEAPARSVRRADGVGQAMMIDDV